MNYPSQVIEEAVMSLSSFPGIGKKTALRMVIHLLKQEQQSISKLTQSIENLKTMIRYCEKCYNISEDTLCTICKSPNRNASIICVVKDFQDAIAIESTGQFKGLYHVLGGLVSPIDGIGPDELQIKSLIERVKTEQTQEVVLALSATIEGDTTSFYISKQLKPLGTKVTMISRGISVGGELEFADEITLARSLLNRIEY